MSEAGDVDLQVEFVETSAPVDDYVDPAAIVRRRRRFRSVAQVLVLLLIAVPAFWWAATRTDPARTRVASVDPTGANSNGGFDDGFFGGPFGPDMQFDQFGNPIEPEGPMSVGPDGELEAEVRVRRDETETFEGEVDEVTNTFRVDFTSGDRVSIAVEQVAGLSDLSGVRILDPDEDVIDELEDFSGPSVEQTEFVVDESGEHAIELTGSDTGLAVSYTLTIERES